MNQIIKGKCNMSSKLESRILCFVCVFVLCFPLVFFAFFGRLFTLSRSYEGEFHSYLPALPVVNPMTNVEGVSSRLRQVIPKVEVSILPHAFLLDLIII